MARVFIGVGTNLGDRENNLQTAQALIEKSSHFTLVVQSPVYETDPVGGPPQNKYLNAVWEIETTLSPSAVLKELLHIEHQMGRARTVPNAPRVIDLDILFYENQIIRQPGLEVPHPRLYERYFVLKPLVDLVPGFVHPALKKTVRQLLEENL